MRSAGWWRRGAALGDAVTPISPAVGGAVTGVTGAVGGEIEWTGGG